MPATNTGQNQRRSERSSSSVTDGRAIQHTDTTRNCTTDMIMSQMTTRNRAKQSTSVVVARPGTDDMKSYPIPPVGTRTSRTMNYTLNKERALNKKLESCVNEHPMQISDTEGGFVLTCNATYFELIKAALPRYIAEHLCLKSEDLAKDKNGAVERVSLKVALKNGRKCCTINLYYTTSKIMINGALSERLIQDHLPEIHSSIKTQLMRYGIRLSTLNQHLRDSLLKATQKKPKTTKQRKTPSQRMIQNSAQNITENRDSIAAQLLTDEPYQHDTSDQGDHAYICPVCQEVVEQESIYCDLCQLWFHSACENVSTHDLMNMADSNDAYTCSLCRSANAEMVNMNTPHDAQLEIRSGGDTVNNVLDYIHPLSPNVATMAVTPPVDVACSVPISGALSLTRAHSEFLTSQLHSTPKTPDIPTTTNPIISAQMAAHQPQMLHQPA